MTTPEKQSICECAEPILDCPFGGQCVKACHRCGLPTEEQYADFLKTVAPEKQSRCCEKCGKDWLVKGAKSLCSNPACECHQGLVAAIENSDAKKLLDRAFNEIADNRELSSHVPYAPEKQSGLTSDLTD